MVEQCKFSESFHNTKRKRGIFLQKDKWQLYQIHLLVNSQNSRSLSFSNFCGFLISVGSLELSQQSPLVKIHAFCVRLIFSALSLART
jgi:hypothetical protein